jgi:hypothetical protein
MSKCPVCAEEIPESAQACPSCLNPVTPEEDGVYQLPEETGEIPEEWAKGALYALELPARCPHCRQVIRLVRVLRLRRTQVSFTSTMPRGGRAVTCPECERILSVELSTL